MDPNNALQNATHAMKLADDWLGIPQVIITILLGKTPVFNCIIYNFLLIRY